MPMSKSRKLALIRSLQNTRNKGDALEVELLIQGKTADARKVRARTDKLSKEIRKLISAAKRSWRGRAEALERDIRSTNARLQRSIGRITRRIEVAQNVVKAVGFIDDAVKLAADLARAVA